MRRVPRCQRIHCVRVGAGDGNGDFGCFNRLRGDGHRLRDASSIGRLPFQCAIVGLSGFVLAARLQFAPGCTENDLQMGKGLPY